jgi:hypothetical protein
MRMNGKTTPLPKAFAKLPLRSSHAERDSRGSRLRR